MTVSVAAHETLSPGGKRASKEQIDRLQAIDHVIEFRLNAVLGKCERKCQYLHEVTDGSLSLVHFDSSDGR